MDGKIIQCINLGVSEESKAYKLYEPSARKVIISKYVVFEEAKRWNWGKKNKASIKESQVHMEKESEVELQEDACVTATRVA